MKNLIIILISIVLLSSCENNNEITVQVLSTGEKLQFDNNIYSKGDTLVLSQKINAYGELFFKIDNNWIIFSEKHKCLEDNCYYKAVVIKNNL